jgi:hypothetical protein
MMAAAFLVDPAHWSLQLVGGVATMQVPDLTDEERQGVIEVVQRLSGGSAGAVEDELVSIQMADWPASMVQAGKRVLKPEQPESETASVPMSRRRSLWRMGNSNFPLFTTAAMRLLSCHASSCAAERNWSAWGRTYTNLRNRLSKEKAEQMIFIKANTSVDEADDVVEL